MTWNKQQMWWLWPLFVYLVLLGYAPLLDTDEGRYAEIAQNIIHTGDWLVPQLNHVLYFEKPPLFYWFNAASFLVFGQNEFTARLVSVVFAVLTLLLTYRLAQQIAGEKVAVCSVMVLSLSVFHFSIGRLVSLDMTVAFFIAWSITEFYRYMQNGRRRHLYLGYVACGLGVMTKGLIGAVLPAGVIGLYVLVSRSWRMLWRLISPVGFALFLLVTAPWFVWMTMRFPGVDGYFGPGGFFDCLIIDHHFHRYASGKSHQEGMFYFFGVVAVGILPSLVFLPRWLLEVRKQGWQLWQRQRGTATFLLTWFGFVFVFFSVSQSKLMPYVAPLFPPLAICVASVLVQWLELPYQQNRWLACWESLFFVAACIALFIIPLATHTLVDRQLWLLGSMLVLPSLLALSLLPWRWSLGKERQARALCLWVGLLFACSPVLMSAFASSYKSGKQIAAALQLHIKPQDTVVHFEGYVNSLAFYSNKYHREREIVVDYPREHRYGVQKLGAMERQVYFPSLQEFVQRWSVEPRRLLCIYRSRALRKDDGQEKVKHELTAILGQVHFLEWRGEYVLFSNREK